MNILCIVCSKLIIDSTDIYITYCGHVFHYQCILNRLDSSRRCPQCECVVVKETIRRLYFSTENDDAINFPLSLKEKEIKTLNEAIPKLEYENLYLTKEVTELKDNIGVIRSEINDLQNNLCFYKNRAAETNRLAEEIVKLKSTIKQIEDAKITTLKKSLVESEIKCSDTDFRLKEVKNKIKLLKQNDVLLERQNAALRREFNLFKLKCQWETNVLKMRLKSAIQNNIMVANPNPGNLDIILTTTVDSANNLSVNAKAVTPKKKKSCSMSSDLSNMENSHNNLSTSLSTIFNMSERTIIVRPDSPFVPEKSNVDLYTAPSTATSNSTNKQKREDIA